MNIVGTINSYAKKIGNIIPEWLIALTMRVSIFFIFWKSVQTKIEGLTIAGQHFAFWGVTDSAVLLFEYEYDLPLLPPNIAAYLATFGEFFLSLGILFGLFTRLSALGLLIMTAVIQIFVYPNAWGVHIVWAAILLYLMRHGAGNVSLDKMLNQA
ncbi:DoxX family protein [Agarilytica rhodophyticola]|uniref:DoxX family protein n=1 Tax=Agarilytica rhodophyticola TaxID=1737490 RepID=UPI000B34629C|nr:DoxX family protein [Agarilytica rhodophyticola]